MAEKELVDLSKYKRREMFERFVKDSNPAMCVTGCFDVTNLYNKKNEHRFNAMLVYCVLKAAQEIEEFHYEIGKDKKLYYCKNVITNVVNNGIDGGLYSGNIHYHDNFKDFNQEYERVREYCINECKDYRLNDGALIGTSAIVNYPFTSFALGNSDDFWASFLLWGKYVKNGESVQLNMTLRFHHAIIDGQHAGNFFNKLQDEIANFNE